MGLRQALGQRIRTLRHARNLTLDGLADKCHRSVDTLSLIERGKNWPSVETIELIASGLNVPIAALFDDLLFPPEGHDQTLMAAGRNALARISGQYLEVVVAMLEAAARANGDKD